jgi:hypothetical protein
LVDSLPPSLSQTPRSVGALSRGITMATAPSSSLTMPPLKVQVCMVTVLQDEARWLPEWLEYHLALGVGHFFLYDDGSTDTLEASLGPYREAALVTLTNVSSLGPPPTHVLTRGWNDAGEPQQREVIFAPQLLAIRHATVAHGHVCRWMAFFDVDEFVAVPKAGGRAFATYLRRLEIRRPAVGGVRLFSVLMLPRNATDRKAPPPDALLLKSFVRRAIEGRRSAKDDPHHIRFKCAARPEALDPQVSHSCPAASCGRSHGSGGWPQLLQGSKLGSCGRHLSSGHMYGNSTYLLWQVYGNVHWLALRRGHEMVSPPEGGAHVCHFRYRWRHTFERRQRKGYLAATSGANATQASHSLGGFSARHRKHKSWVVAQWRSSLFHMWSPSCRGMHTRTHARTHARTHMHARTHAHLQAGARSTSCCCATSSAFASGSTTATLRGRRRLASLRRRTSARWCEPSAPPPPPPGTCSSSASLCALPRPLQPGHARREASSRLAARRAARARASPGRASTVPPCSRLVPTRARARHRSRRRRRRRCRLSRPRSVSPPPRIPGRRRSSWRPRRRRTERGLGWGWSVWSLPSIA